MSDSTLPQNPDTQALLQAIAELSKRLDGFESSNNKRFDSIDAQFTSIREGIVLNSVRFDRLEAKILNLNANFTELSEDLRRAKSLV